MSGFFDYIEDLVENENSFTMEQFSSSVNAFLNFRKFQILPDGRKGMISHEEAKMKAEAEYDIFNRTQKVLSDFDKLLNKHNE